MFKKQPNHLLDLPADLEFFCGFPQSSLDDRCLFYVVEFERRQPDQSDQYYVAILPFDAPVISSDPVAVFGAALVWDCAPNAPVLAHKISAWLGEML